MSKASRCPWHCTDGRFHWKDGRTRACVCWTALRQAGGVDLQPHEVCLTAIAGTNEHLRVSSMFTPTELETAEEDALAIVERVFERHLRGTKGGVDWATAQVIVGAALAIIVDPEALLGRLPYVDGL